ncbi:MAG: hypothetical protein NXH97_20295 [Rhodobacteraceae bacterium]|nr:hypothetical protein [Paracoccaceae bacterium]
MKTVLFAGALTLVAAMQMGDGVSIAEIATVDARVETEHVSLQPGFAPCETGASEAVSVATVHWASSKAALASMGGFAPAPTAAKFMSIVDAESTEITRDVLDQ